MHAVEGVAEAFAGSVEAGGSPSVSARQLGLAAGGRVLWLGPSGTVWVDGFGNAGRVGTRLSLPPGWSAASGPQAGVYASGAGWVAYAIAPLEVDAQPDGAILLVRDLTPLQREVTAIQARLWLLDSLLGAVGVVGGAGLAGSLARPLEGLQAAIRRMGAGELRQAVVPAGSAETAALAAAFNDMAARVAALDEQRRAFVADAAHELRTPLAGLQALAEAGRDGAAPPREVMGGVVRQSARLGRLVDDLLALARLDDPEIRLQAVALRTTDLLDEALWVVSPLADERGVGWARLEASAVAWVRGDPDWLHRALVNVLDNAVRHSPPGTTVHVAIQRVGGRVHVLVRDEGPGVAPEVLLRLGRRFYRPDAARDRAHGGAGLGLAIASDVLRRHGGRLTFASPPGEGLRVTMDLPAASLGAGEA